MEKTSGKTSGKILDAVRQNPQVTIPELSAQIGVTTRSIERSQCLFFPRGDRIDIFDCGYPIMDLTDLHKARGKRVRGKRTVYDIAGHLFGADGSRALPRDASARIKRLIRARAAAKAAR